MASQQYDIKELKAGGLMKQKEPDLFSIRLRVVGGRIDVAQLQVLAEVADKYGQGHVHLTTRQGVEIPYVNFKHVEALREHLAKAELEFGACGPRVRTITACQGEACSHGMIDCQKLAEKIDERVFGRSGLPHKFKVGITGCPNACIKPQENDLGIMGIAVKSFDEEACDRCSLCVHACPVPDTLSIEDEKLVFNEKNCVSCAACVAACPNDAWQIVGTGYTLFVGGKMGKRPRFGDRLSIQISDEDHLLRLLDEVIEWYAANGNKGERFGETIDRVGLDKLAAALATH
ncbi:MAG: 4Fe-4S dicluster domain-containing protein [Planctomycetes bacterium]|nr:4Fe-4S dicluster domain-containing protein [Planctomycetota bacterium]